MPTHKFEYVVSGIDLNDEQKAAISAAIAAAVSQSLINSTARAGLVKGSVWGALHGINGGNWAYAANKAELNKRLAVEHLPIK